MTGMKVRLADAIGGNGLPLAPLPLQRMEQSVFERNCSSCAGSALDSRQHGSPSGQSNA